MSADDTNGQPAATTAQPYAVEPTWPRVLLTALGIWLGRTARIKPHAPWILVIGAVMMSGALLVSAIEHVSFALMAMASIVWSITGLLIVNVAFSLLERVPGRHRRTRAGVAGISARSLTAVASALAGRAGWSLHQESDAHLAGESGHDVASWAKVKQAAGFVKAGVRYRGQDWADAAWKPVDAVLRSRTLSNLVVAVPTIVIAFEVLTHKGTMTLLTSLGSIFGTWLFLAGMIKAGRKYRDAEPPEPRARQAKE